MSLPVTHTWRKGNFKSDFKIECTKTLINFVSLYYQILCATKEETQSEMSCGRGKPRPKG